MPKAALLELAGCLGAPAPAAFDTSAVSGFNVDVFLKIFGAAAAQAFARTPRKELAFRGIAQKPL